MSPQQIAQFLEDFRQMRSGLPASGRSKLISMKVPETLLAQFKASCKSEGVPYQRKIKELMRSHLLRSGR